MKFITLTNQVDKAVYINPITITALSPIPDPIGKEARTQVYTMGSSCWFVLETVEEIQKLIKESENIHTLTWSNAGPR